MKIKDRYIAKTLLSYILVVTIVWLSIYSFFNFISELNFIGNASYTILEAFIYILLQVPEAAYDQASALILLGCILGMGHLVTTSQLLIFRAAGVSVLKITLLTLKNAIIFLFLLTLIGETIAPSLTQFAENERSKALGQSSFSGGQDGFWIRDGGNFIHVENNLDGSQFHGITIFELNEENKIKSVINSDVGFFDGKSLSFNETEIFLVTDDNVFENISLERSYLYNKNVAFDKGLIASLEKEPKDLSILTIINQIEFLTENKLRASVFEVELYNRLAKPLTLVAMILISMLFIFGSSRDITFGRKIFIGVTIGLSFELISRLGGAFSLSYDFSPFLSLFAPSFLAAVASILILIINTKHS